MSEKSKQIDKTTSGSSTLAHELVAREEQNIGTFFAAFAIQYYCHSTLLRQKISEPLFIKFFGDVEVYASQRVLIKNIITNKNYKPINDELEKLFMEYNPNDERLPHNLFLSRMNKAFLIRQIFKHTDQVLSRYHFIDEYVGLDISKLDLSELFEKMESLTVDQQILVMVRIFSHMKDSFENKKKSLLQSFLENLKRTREEFIARGKKVSQEMSNLDMMLKKFNN